MEQETKKLVVIDPMKVHPLHIVAFIETFVFVLLLGFFVGKGIFQRTPKSEAENVITILTEKFTDIGELATLQYDYDAIDRVTSAKATWYGIKIPGTADTIEIKISGTIKFGINLRDVRIIADEDSKGNIKIKIPKAKILSHELDHKSADITSLKVSILNNMQQSFAEVFDMANEAFSKIKAEKEKSDKVKEYMERATENAKTELEILLKPILPKDKSVQFEFF